MYCGVFCTIAPKLHGNSIILGAILLYGIFTDFTTFASWMLFFLVITTILVEISSYLLRIYLTKSYSISRTLAINILAGNLAGVVATNALIGSGWGIWLWQFIAGKTLLPHFDATNTVLRKLVAIALFRIIFGIVIITFALFYIIK
jgi:hypothetical protein